MPSRKKRRPTTSKTNRRARHTAFFPLLILSFIFWFVYRGIFQFSVLFDELIGKAIFFGLPVWLYILVSGFKDIAETFAPHKIRRGLMIGVAVGGLYGFTAALVATWQSQFIYPSFAFLTDRFWLEFGQALLTGFWETLFFFSFVMMVALQFFKNWSTLAKILFVVAVFLLFHLPNVFLRFQGIAVWYQVVLLSFFALGQSLFFLKEKNGFALAISHALWGMVLLFHF
jgi:hypothetical protein